MKGEVDEAYPLDPMEAVLELLHLAFLVCDLLLQLPHLLLNIISELDVAVFSYLLDPLDVLLMLINLELLLLPLAQGLDELH